MKTPVRDVTCRRCGLVSVGEAHPDGWYALSVNDMNAPNGKYRYLGLFCSIVCLAQHLPEMSKVEADIQYRREHSR